MFRALYALREILPCRTFKERRMAFVYSLFQPAPMLAVGGVFIFLGAMLGLALAAYAIYWIIFKLGKD